MKGVFLQNGDIHKETHAQTEQRHTDGREGEMRGRRGGKKKKSEREKSRKGEERGRQSGSRIDRFAPTHHHLLHCVWNGSFEAREPLRGS